MRFLHLADLHIGKSVNGFSMLEEQRHVFSQVAGYVETEKPDAVLIAGDVYDRAVPSVEAVRLFDDLLTGFADANVSVLLVSGNHDSPDRLGFASRLLSERKLHLCGVFDGRLMSVTLADEHGEVDFWLLPFVKPSAIRGLAAARALRLPGGEAAAGLPEAGPEAGGPEAGHVGLPWAAHSTDFESYTDAVAAALGTASIDTARRNVLVSHQFYAGAGAAPIRSESELSPIGGLDAVDASILSRFDYAALGHLHRAQSPGGNARYAGSPLKYSFSEWKQQKSATLVTLRAKGDVEIAELPLTPMHDMREIRGAIADLMSAGNRSLDCGGLCDDYLRVILTDEDEIIDPMGKLQAVFPNIMGLAFDNSRSRREESLAPLSGHARWADAASTLAAASPYDLFGEFFLEATGASMTEAQAAVARELLEGGDGE